MPAPTFAPAFSGNISYVNLPTPGQSTNSPANPTPSGNPIPSTPTTPPSLPNNNIDITNPFDNVVNKEVGNQAPTNNQSTTNPTQTPSTNKPAEPSFDEIVNSKNFGAISKDLFDKIAEGNVDDFNAGLQSIVKQVYRTAIEDSSKLMDFQMKNLEAKIMKQVNVNKQADIMVADLKKAVPYANDPAIEPIAKQVFSGYLRKGLSQAEALGATSQYFNNLASRIGDSQNPSQSSTGAKTGSEAWDELFN